MSDHEYALRKLEKQLEETFVDSVKSSKPEELKDLVVRLSQDLEEVRFQQKEDPTRKEHLEILKDINGGYNSTKKELTNRIKLVLLTLEAKGKV